MEFVIFVIVIVFTSIISVVIYAHLEGKTEIKENKKYFYNEGFMISKRFMGQMLGFSAITIMLGLAWNFFTMPVSFKKGIYPAIMAVQVDSETRAEALRLRVVELEETSLRKKPKPPRKERKKREHHPDRQISRNFGPGKPDYGKADRGKH